MNKSFIDDLCIGSEFGGNIQNTGFEEELENLAMYYILRYYLGAIDSYDVISTIKRLVCAEVVITALCQSKNADFAKRAAIMQTYSKEVEHSYENNELLEEKFSTLSDFSVEKLIAVLNKGN
jgi:hypothetical protein